MCQKRIDDAIAAGGSVDRRRGVIDMPEHALDLLYEEWFAKFMCELNEQLPEIRT